MDQKKPSIEEILAKARQQGAAGGKAQEKSKPDEPAQEPAEAASSEAAAAPPKPPAKSKPAAGGGMSVADILAAARGGQKPAEKAAAPAEPKPKPAAKPAKPAAKEAEPAVAEGGVHAGTASILEAARAESKRGPKSKAEAGVADSEKPSQEAGPVKAKPRGVAPPMPPKPEYAKKPPARAAAKPDTEERRGFVFMLGVMVGTSLGVGFTSLATTLSMWMLGTARFMFPNIITEPPSRFKVGLPAEFAPDQVSEKFKASSGIWVVNAEYNGQRQIYALSTVCNHLGCTPNWLEAEQKFKCPCHGSGFYKDGINFEGPAPRPLERYAIRLAEYGQLEVDKSRKFQEEKGEWASPDCFVQA